VYYDDCSSCIDAGCDWCADGYCVGTNGVDLCEPGLLTRECKEEKRRSRSSTSCFIISNCSACVAEASCAVCVDSFQNWQCVNEGECGFVDAYTTTIPGLHVGPCPAGGEQAVVPAPSSGDDTISQGALAGIIIGCVFGGLLLAAVLFFIARRCTDVRGPFRAPSAYSS